MTKSEYLAPQSLDYALEVLRKNAGRAKLIAGGTDLIPRMRSGIVQPGLLVDVSMLFLDSIELNGDFIHIGAGVTHTAIVESDLLSIQCPLLVEAAEEIAGPPIRNRGTVGGNLANASPAADLATSLLACDANVVLVGPKPEREVPLAKLFDGPGKTVLATDEILTEIRVPKKPPSSISKFIKLGKRKAMAISIVNLAVRFTLDDDGRIAQARIALGSVAPTPIRAVRAETTLEGERPGLELFAEAGYVASTETSPISDIRASGDYRKKMVAVLTRRALAAIWVGLGDNSIPYWDGSRISKITG